MNVNVEENVIQMCSKIKAPSQYDNAKNIILFITMSNIF